MIDDEMTDGWLREAMSGETPRLSAAFDAKVIASVRPRGLTGAGRVVIALYAIAALALAAWVMRDMGVALVSASIPVAALVAVGVSRYVRGVIVRTA